MRKVLSERENVCVGETGERERQRERGRGDRVHICSVRLDS